MAWNQGNSKSPWASVPPQAPVSSFRDVMASQQSAQSSVPSTSSPQVQVPTSDTRTKPYTQPGRPTSGPGAGEKPGAWRRSGGQQWSGGGQITPSARRGKPNNHPGSAKGSTNQTNVQGNDVTAFLRSADTDVTRLPSDNLSTFPCNDALGATAHVEPRVGQFVDNKMSSVTSVVNIRKAELRKIGYKDLEEWVKGETHVYIGRDMTLYVPGAKGSKWCNPFVSKKYGRDECCRLYREYVLSDKKVHENGKTLLQSLNELKGKTLGCWCHPERCHGHELVKLISEYSK